MGKPQADEDRRRTKAGAVDVTSPPTRRERERVEEATRLVIERRREVLENLAKH